MEQGPPPYYPDCPILKDGYLIKRGGSRGGWKTWKRRWFVLDSHKQLAYFESVKAYAKRKQPLGVLLVDRTFSARAGPVYSGVSGDNECLFEVEIAEPTRKRVIVLKSETPSDRRDWLIALLKVQHLDLQSMFNPSGSTSTTPAVVPRSITTPHASPLVPHASPLVVASRMPSVTTSSPGSYISVPERPSALYGFSPHKGYANRMKSLQARGKSLAPPIPAAAVSKEKALQVNDLLRDTESSPEHSLSTTTPAAFFAASAAVFSSAPLNTAAEDSDFSVFTSVTSTNALPTDSNLSTAPTSSTLQPPSRGPTRYDSDDSMHSEGRLDTPFTPPPPPPKHISPIVAPALKVSLTRNATTLGFSRGPIRNGTNAQAGTSHSQAITFLGGNTEKAVPTFTQTDGNSSGAATGKELPSFDANTTIKDKTLILGGSTSAKPAAKRSLSMPRRSPDFSSLALFANETRERIRNTPPMATQRLKMGASGLTRSRGDSNPNAAPSSLQSRALLKFKSEANLLRSDSPVFYGSDQGYSSARLPHDQSAPAPAPLTNQPPVVRASSRNPILKKNTSDAEFDAKAAQNRRPIMALRSKSSHGLQKRSIHFYEPPSDEERDSDPDEEDDSFDTPAGDTATFEIPLTAKDLLRAQSDYMVPNRYLRAQSVGARVPSQQTTDDYRPSYSGATSDTHSLSSHARSAYSSISGLDPDSDWRQRPSGSMLPRRSADANDFTFSSTAGVRSSGDTSDTGRRDTQRKPYAHKSERGTSLTRRRSELSLSDRPGLPTEFKGSIGSPEDDPVLKLPSGRLVFPNPSEVTKMSDSEFQMLLDSYMVAAKMSIQARREAIANRE